MVSVGFVKACIALILNNGRMAATGQMLRKQSAPCRWL